MCSQLSYVVFVVCSVSVALVLLLFVCLCFFFQAEDGIRDLVRSRGLGDVYKRQPPASLSARPGRSSEFTSGVYRLFYVAIRRSYQVVHSWNGCLLYTSDAADERSSVDLGGRRIIKKKKKGNSEGRRQHS